MKILDRLFALAIFIFAIVDSLLVPKNYTGRLWIFGTCLALLFVAMLNWLRIRNPGGVHSLKAFCVTANVTMLALAICLIASIGLPRTFANPQVPLIAFLLLVETLFSLGKTA